MLRTIVRNWWVFVVRGLCALLFGVAAFVWPHTTFFALVMLFGAFALADGIIELIAAPVLPSSRFAWWMTLEGILGIAVGGFTFFYPRFTALALVIALGVWLAMAGLLRIAFAIELRKELVNEWLMVLSGILAIVAGMLAAIWPGPSATALMWVVGAYAVIYGVLMLVLGAKLHHLETIIQRASAAC